MWYSKAISATDVAVLKEVVLGERSCVVDGLAYEYALGSWAFYLPALSLKLLHAVDGFQHCLHASAPSREDVTSRRPFPTRPEYSQDDWLRAYSTPVTRRAAENIVAARRLHAAGLGPAVTGIVFAHQFEPWYGLTTVTAGYFVENLKWKLPKRKTTKADLARAGVVPDRINSCLREQIRGYVSDLNSVVGVMPVDAEKEILGVQGELERYHA